MANVFRQYPTGRLTTQSLYKQASSNAVQTIATNEFGFDKKALESLKITWTPTETNSVLALPSVPNANYICIGVKHKNEVSGVSPPYSRRNKRTLKVFGTGWSCEWIVGNAGYDGSTAGYNENAMMGVVHSGTTEVYANDYAYYNSGGYTEALIESWMYSVHFLKNDVANSRFILGTWTYIYADSTVRERVLDIKTYAEIRNDAITHSGITSGQAATITFGDIIDVKILNDGGGSSTPVSDDVNYYKDYTVFNRSTPPSKGEVLEWATTEGLISGAWAYYPLVDAGTYTANDFSGNARNLTDTSDNVFSVASIAPIFNAVDSSAPNLSDLTASATSSSAWSGSVTVAESGGTFYKYITTDGSHADWEIAEYGSTQSVSTTGSIAISGSGLAPSTLYYLQIMYVDASGNWSTSLSTSFTTDAGSGGEIWAVSENTSGSAVMLAGAYDGIATGIEHVMIRESDPTSNFQFDFLRASSYGASDARHFLERVDTSGLPTGNTLAAVRLKFKQINYVNDGPANPEQLAASVCLRTTWGESTATWNKYDGTNDWATAGGSTNSSDATLGQDCYHTLDAADNDSYITLTISSGQLAYAQSRYDSGLPLNFIYWLYDVNTAAPGVDNGKEHQLYSNWDSDGDKPIVEFEFASSGSTINCNTGSATAAGYNASINKTVNGVIGSASAQGYTSSLNSTLSCAIGNATAQGLQAGLNYSISCSVGAATAQGLNASLNKTIEAQTGQAVAQGYTASIGAIISCNVGVGVAIGYTASINTVIGANVGQSVASGYNASLNVSISTNIGDATAAGYSASLNSGNTIACSTGQAAAQGYLTSINYSIGCSIGNAVANGYQASLSNETVINCAIGNAIAQGSNATINVTINCNAGSSVAAGYQANLNAAGEINCNTAIATASGYKASVNSVINASRGDALAVGNNSQLTSIIACGTALASANGFTATISQHSTLVCAEGNAVAIGYQAFINQVLSMSAGNAEAIGYNAILQVFNSGNSFGSRRSSGNGDQIVRVNLQTSFRTSNTQTRTRK